LIPRTATETFFWKILTKITAKIAEMAFATFSPRQT
jgi:hypothetical protein